MERSLAEQLLAQQDWIRRLAAHLTGDSHLADEVAQETWVRVLDRPPGHTSRLRAWLGQVVRSVIRERHRSDERRRSRERSVAPPGRPESPEAVAARVQLQQELVHALMELPRPQRDVLLLRFFEGCTSTETAARLGVAPGTVDSRQHRALAALRARLTERKGTRDWLPILAAWVRGDGSLAPAGIPVAMAAGGALMSALTWKVLAASAVLAMAGTALWWSHDAPVDTATSLGAGSVPETLAEVTDASAAVPAARRELDSPTQGPGAAAGLVSPAPPSGSSLTLQVLAQGVPIAARLILYDDSFHLGPSPTDDQGTVVFEPPDGASGPARALVLPDVGLPEVHPVPTLAGSLVLVLAQGPAAVRGRVLVEGGPPKEPVPLSLLCSSEPWSLELPPEIGRLANLHRAAWHETPIVTDAEGRFEILALPEGWRGRLKTTDLHQIEGSTGIDRGGIELQAPMDDLVLHLHEVPSVRGIAVDDATGQPLEDGMVECQVQFQDGRRSPSIGFFLGQEGRFCVAVPYVWPVDYGNRSLYPAFERIWISVEQGGAPQTFEFDARALEQDGDVGVLRVHSAGRDQEFRVVDSRGDPIRGAAALAGLLSTLTDASGRGVLRGLADGTDELTVGAVGFGTVTQALDKNQDEPMVVELPDTNLLTVKVRLGTLVPANQSLTVRSEPGLFPQDDRARRLWYKLLWEGSFLSASWDRRTEIRLRVPPSGELMLQELTPGQDLKLELEDRLAGTLARVAVPGLGAEERRTVEIGCDRQPWFLRGQVVDASGAPAAGGRVTYGTEKGKMSATTDGEGRFELGPLFVPAGQAGTLVAESQGSASDARPVQKGDPSPLRLDLQSGLSLRAEVLDEEDHPVAVRICSVVWPGDDLGIPGTRTGVNTFSFGGLPREQRLTLNALVGERWYEQECSPSESVCELRVPVHGTLVVRAEGGSAPDRRDLQVIATSRAGQLQWPLGFGEHGMREATQLLLPGTYLVVLEVTFGGGKERPPPRQVEVFAGATVFLELELPPVSRDAGR